MHPRLVGAVVSVVAIVATASPVLRRPARDDSFPLSTYPMFAFSRPLKQTFEYAVGYTDAGERRTIRPRHVANAEVMQAIMTFASAVRRRAVPELCDRIAARVAADPALADVTTVQIVRGTHDALAFLVHGERGPERQLATCAVPRPGAR